MKSNLLYVFLLFTCFSMHAAYAQDSQGVIELKEKLKIQTTDSAKIRVLLDIAIFYRQGGDRINSKKYAEEALNKASIAKHYLADCKRILGLVYRDLGEKDKAMNWINESLNDARNNGDRKVEADALNDIGITFYYNELIDSTLIYFIQAAKIREKIGDSTGMAVSFNNIGQIYMGQENRDKAMEYFKKALKLFGKSGDKFQEAMVMNNIGNIYKIIDNDYEEALKFYFSALESMKLLEKKTHMAQYMGNIGNTYVKMEKYDQAKKYLEESVRLMEEVGDKKNYSHTIYNLAMFYFDLKDYDKTTEYAIKSLHVAKEIGSVNRMRDAYLLLSSSYEHKGDYKNAHENYKLQDHLGDSLDKLRNKDALDKLSVEYETEKKELQIKNLENEKAFEKAETDRQKTQKLFFGFGLMAALVLGFMLLYGFIRKRRDNRIILQQKLEVEYQKEVVEEKSKEIMDSINYAKRLQEAILPPWKLVQEYLPESFILYKPKDIVAGDFYWTEVSTSIDLTKAQGNLEYNRRVIFIAAADCTGHGVPGALVSVVCSNALNRAVKEFGITEPGKILDKVRELVIETFEKSESEVKDGMDISLCALNLEAGRLQWAGANNPLWIIRKEEGGNNELIEYKPDKQPIGRYEGVKPFKTHVIELQEGDSLYVFSDGYADQFGGEKGKKFKTSNFKTLLLSIKHEPMNKQQQLIEDAFMKWKNNLEQVDDVCVIGVRV